MIVKTRTGSTYEFNEDLTKFRRAEVGADSQTLRQDGDWLEILDISDITIGESIRILMPVLDPPQIAGAQVTWRTTSEVVSIEADFTVVSQGQIVPA